MHRKLILTLEEVFGDLSAVLLRDDLKQRESEQKRCANGCIDTEKKYRAGERKCRRLPCLVRRRSSAEKQVSGECSAKLKALNKTLETDSRK